MTIAIILRKDVINFSFLPKPNQLLIGPIGSHHNLYKTGRCWNIDVIRLVNLLVTLLVNLSLNLLLSLLLYFSLKLSLQRIVQTLYQLHYLHNHLISYPILQSSIYFILLIHQL